MLYDEYETVIVMFSGGKDSWACLLHILDDGCPREKIELWHHCIDGNGASTLMDWPCTSSYVRACADAIGVPVYFSWKVGGFEREMLRSEERTAPTQFELPDGALGQAGGKGGKESTRCMFPQVSANLSVRWCSAYLKIDVAACALRNQERFNERKTLVVTGERAEESTSRSRYAEFETHRADGRNGKTKRHIDHWRPVHKWTAQEVWEKIREWGINPHPAYRLGWGRVSCMNCIFASKNQWASVREISPKQFEEISLYENLFGKTINRSKTVIELADNGVPYEMQSVDVAAALSKSWDEEIFVDNWVIPSGAYGETCGPM